MLAAFKIPTCPLTTCEPDDDFQGNYFNNAERLQWLTGDFTNEFFEMRAKDTKTFNHWMRTPATKLADIIEKTRGSKAS